MTDLEWKTGKPVKACHCIIETASDGIELAWFSIAFHGGTWFRYCQESICFEDFILDREIIRWIQVDEIIALIINQRIKKDATPGN